MGESRNRGASKDEGLAARVTEGKGTVKRDVAVVVAQEIEV